MIKMKDLDKKENFNKGITLIALVITIIVLLILAGVTIATLIGENGNLNQAENSKTETLKASALEMINLAITSNKTEDDNTLLNNLQEIENAEIEIINIDAYYVTINGFTFTVYEDESIYTDKVQFWNGNISTDFFTGNGTEEDPYLIKNCEDMAYLANKVNNGNSFEGKYFKLIANLDFGARKDENNKWNKLNIPYIGINSDTPFSGTFNGDNNHIRGIGISVYLTPGKKNKGLFGYNKGFIENIIVSGENYIESGQFANVGLIIGNNEGTITNCNNISRTTVAWGAYSNTGILIGSNSSEIVNCYNAGNIKTSSNISAIAGMNQENAIIKNCYNTGTITGSIITGIAYENYGNVDSCYNSGNMDSTGQSSGIVLTNRATGVVSNCYNTGNVRNAGICKSNFGIVKQSFNTGNVYCEGGVYIGGVVGINSNLVINCYNIGTVQTGSQVGGIVGLGTKGQVKNCYNTGTVIGSTHRNAITGNGPAGINCYYLDTSTKDSNSSVISKTKEELQSEEMLVLLNNEEEVWTHDANKNNGFPIIINE